MCAVFFRATRGKKPHTLENPVYGVLRLDPWRIELYDLLNLHNRRVWYAEGEQTPSS